MRCWFDGSHCLDFGYFFVCPQCLREYDSFGIPLEDKGEDEE
jgi:hypothetical protein